MLAAQEKADDAAKLLVEAGADLDAQNKVRPMGVHMYMRGGWLARGRAGASPSVPHACMCRCAVVTSFVR